MFRDISIWLRCTIYKHTRIQPVLVLLLYSYSGRVNYLTIVEENFETSQHALEIPTHKPFDTPLSICRSRFFGLLLELGPPSIFRFWTRCFVPLICWIHHPIRINWKEEQRHWMMKGEMHHGFLNSVLSSIVAIDFPHKPSGPYRSRKKITSIITHQRLSDLFFSSMSQESRGEVSGCLATAEYDAFLNWKDKVLGICSTPSATPYQIVCIQTVVVSSILISPFWLVYLDIGAQCPESTALFQHMLKLQFQNTSLTVSTIISQNSFISILNYPSVGALTKRRESLTRNPQCLSFQLLDWSIPSILWRLKINHPTLK